MKENSVQRKENSSKLKVFVLLFLLFSIHYSLFTKKAIAQSAISLSVSPPLFELMIQPGKEVKQVYSLTNNGGETTVTPKIQYFITSELNGEVELTEELAPDWVKYSNDPIKIKGGDKIDFNVLFSPPSDAEEVDHFLTLTFETVQPTDILGQNSTFYTTQIGTNILVTISKDGNPNKSAEIIEFTAPKIVDSFLMYFYPLEYTIILRNNGNSFWKPIGKIITDNENLKIAAQNIISGSSRNIGCIENENLTNCKTNKITFGKITSKLEFSLDDSPKIYKGQAITYSFPFSFLVLIILLLTIFKSRGILKIWRKRK